MIAPSATPPTKKERSKLINAKTRLDRLQRRQRGKREAGNRAGRRYQEGKPVKVEMGRTRTTVRDSKRKNLGRSGVDGPAAAEARAGGVCQGGGGPA